MVRRARIYSEEEFIEEVSVLKKLISSYLATVSLDEWTDEDETLEDFLVILEEKWSETQ